MKSDTKALDYAYNRMQWADVGRIEMEYTPILAQRRIIRNGGTLFCIVNIKQQ